jgi:hypothetical protein
MSKTTVTRTGDTFTAVTEPEYSPNGFKSEGKTRSSSLEYVLNAAKSYKRTLEEIEAAAFFMEAALGQFYESETDLCHLEVKGVGAIFGMIRDSIELTHNGCFVEGQIIENGDF